MKAFLILAGLAFAGLAISGEDSTDHWGAGGTGPAWYDTPCGLALDGRFGGSPWDIQYAASCGERFDQSRYASGWQAGMSARPALGGF